MFFFLQAFLSLADSGELTAQEKGDGRLKEEILQLHSQHLKSLSHTDFLHFCVVLYSKQAK